MSSEIHLKDVFPAENNHEFEHLINEYLHILSLFGCFFFLQKK